jgi:hypothetical protein
VRALKTHGEEKMIGNWSDWKKFPNAERGEHVEAPIGPGIYEVRNMCTGDLAAFDASGNVANALAALLRKPPSHPWAKLFSADRGSWPDNHWEYRTCAASSMSEAKIMAQALLGRRQVYWRRNAPRARSNFARSI